MPLGSASPAFLTSHKSLTMWSPRAWKEAEMLVLSWDSWGRQG